MKYILIPIFLLVLAIILYFTLHTKKNKMSEIFDKLSNLYSTAKALSTTSDSKVCITDKARLNSISLEKDGLIVTIQDIINGDGSTAEFKTKFEDLKNKFNSLISEYNALPSCSDFCGPDTDYDPRTISCRCKDPQKTIRVWGHTDGKLHCSANFCPTDGYFEDGPSGSIAHLDSCVCNDPTKIVVKDSGSKSARCVSCPAFSSPNEAKDNCICNQGYYMSDDQKMCILDCRNKPHMKPSDDNKSCICESGFIMKDGNCVKDCSTVPNSTIGPDGITCVCLNGFTKDAAGNCVGVCTAPNTHFDGKNCVCNDGFMRYPANDPTCRAVSDVQNSLLDEIQKLYNSTQGLKGQLKY